MATLRQRKFAKKISKNIQSKGKPKPLSVLARESGYSPSMSQAVGKIMRAKGFQRLLRGAGLDETLIVKKYREAIEQKPDKTITYEVQRRYLEDLASYLDIKPKEEAGKITKIGAYIEKFLVLKEREKLEGPKEKELPKEE